MGNKNTETKDINTLENKDTTNSASKEASRKIILWLTALLVIIITASVYNAKSVKSDKVQPKTTEVIEEIEYNEDRINAEIDITNVNTQDDNASSSFQSISENSINKEQEQSVDVIDREENSNEYVVYTLALVIDPDNITDNQRFRCVINKNEPGSKSGLVDIVVDGATLPLIAPSGTEKTVEEYKADIKVNHYGEWLYTGKYYVVRIDESKTLDAKGTNIERFRAKSIGLATDADIENWKQGRALNSTFLTDMEVIKKSEPLDIYDEICNEYQYTWTFEQIEAFKAYVESLDETNKNKWLSAAEELDLTLGY